MAKQTLTAIEVIKTPVSVEEEEILLTTLKIIRNRCEFFSDTRVDEEGFLCDKRVVFNNLDPENYKIERIQGATGPIKASPLQVYGMKLVEELELFIKDTK